MYLLLALKKQILIKLDFLDNNKATEDKIRIRIRNPAVQIRGTGSGSAPQCCPHPEHCWTLYKKLKTDTIQAEEKADPRFRQPRDCHGEESGLQDGEGRLSL